MPITDTARRPRQFWRRRRVLVPVLAAIPLLTVGADFTALKFTEWRTAQAFHDATGATSRVDIQDRPVIPQLARGTLDRVDISAQDIPADSANPIAVAELDVHMTNLKRNSDADTAQAGSTTATALVTYRDISDALGIEVKADGTPGRIAATIDAPLVGRFGVSARVTKGGPTSIAFEDLSIDSDRLPESARKLISDVFDRSIPLRNIPHGLTLDSVSTNSSGLTARLSGRDVTFKMGGSSESDL
ncbi:DUF2993 domain-containing protein [Streptomyces sp. NPDC093544]|jgi:hypothetical protein|uniref:LmeA family phospholipid-binding protein n=1 Tax=Streptomyces sp. NPDC093544 TaxID=3155200 RepID=UPI00342C7638